MKGNVHSARVGADPLDVVVANLPLPLLLGGLFATLFAIAAGVGVLVLVSGALLSFPEFEVNGITLDGTWVLVRFAPLLVLHGGIAGSVAYAVWTERPWSRILTIAFLVTVIVSASVAAILHPVGGRFWFLVALGCLPVLTAANLYLYLWKPVTAYYTSLRNERELMAMDEKPWCEQCAGRKKAEENPRSIFAFFWRLHTKICPGWKSYQRWLKENA